MTDNAVRVTNRKGLAAYQQWDWMTLWLPLLGILPLLLMQGLHLWEKPHLQFFPVTLAVVCWVAFNELPKERYLAKGKRFWVAVVFLVLSIFVNLSALLLYSPWLAHLGILFTFCAWSLVRLHSTDWPRIVAMWALLVSTVPLPLNIDQKLIAKLQDWSSNACALALDALQIPNFLQGNVLQIENHTLFVEEACSGVTSLYSLISISLVFSLLQRRSFLQALLTLFITPFVAINGNILRLLLIALGFEWWNVDLTKGYPHDAIGLLAFLSSAVALICFAQIFSLLFATIPKLKAEKSLFRRIYNLLTGWPKPRSPEEFQDISDEEDDFGDEEDDFGDEEEDFGDEGGDRTKQASSQTASVPKLSFGKSPVFTLMLVLYGVFFVPVFLAVLWQFTIERAASVDRATIGATMPIEYASQFPNEKSLPSELPSGWRVSGFRVSTRELESKIGQYSHTWRLVKGDKSIILSIDFAFRGWHGLEQCYRNSGWKVTDIKRRIRSATEWSWVECQMTNDLETRGYLWYSLFDENNLPYENDVDGIGLDRRFKRRTIFDILAGAAESTVPRTFQTQIFVETGRPLDEEYKQELTSLYLELRELLRTQSVPALQKLKER